MRALLSRMLRAGKRAPGLWRTRSFLLAQLAAAHRRRLARTTFVGITGSAGKTTAMRLTSAVLSARGKVCSSHRNTVDGVADIVLATKVGDDFSVIELSAYPRDSLERALAIVKPKIGVITSIGMDHIRAFPSVEAIAAEKAKVIQGLPSDGVAVLNADDPRVIAMANRAPCQVITYGRATSAEVRAENIRSNWPERLSFTAMYREERIEVRTQLCGSHWVSAALAALAVGLASGIPLNKAAKAIELVEPYHHRMYPLTSRDGVSFILDDWKSALWTVPSTFEFMKTAAAPRKFMVFGTLSDYRGGSERAYKHTAISALEVAEQVIFVGPMATSALRAKSAENEGRIHTFATIKGAAAFLSSLLRKGDLVLLKGAVKVDHLGRLAHNFVEPISCWSMDCRKNTRCSSCDELRSDVQVNQRQRDLPSPVDGAHVRRSLLPAELLDLTRPVKVLVGIGNPGNEYRNTPHNVGHQVIDMLAQELGIGWQVYGNTALAFANLEGNTILLVKPLTYVNNIGVALKELSEAIGFEAQDCVLIQDDVSLSLGKLRGRARGSDGGHKGVRSALIAFQTDEIQRFKIGVAPQNGAQAITDYVVKPFSPEAIPIIESAVRAATDRLLSELVKAASGPPRKHAANSPSAPPRTPR